MEAVEDVEASAAGADCVWDGTGDDVDAASMNSVCALYTESECISSMNGKSKGRCTWRGKMHSKMSKMHVNVDVEEADSREEMVAGWTVDKVMKLQFSTFDVLLGSALFATLAFAIYQLYQWCLYKAKVRDYSPINDV